MRWLISLRVSIMLSLVNKAMGVSPLFAGSPQYTTWIIMYATCVPTGGKPSHDRAPARPTHQRTSERITRMLKCPHCQEMFDEAQWKTQDIGLSDVRMVIVYCPNCKTVLSIFNLDIALTSLSQITDMLTALTDRMDARDRGQAAGQ